MISPSLLLWPQPVWLLADSPPLGIPTAFWPALAIGFAVGWLFYSETIVPGPRHKRTEKLLEEAQLANKESVPALKEATVIMGKFVEERRKDRREGR